MEPTLLSHLAALVVLSIIAAFIGFGFQRMMDVEMIFYPYRKLITDLRYKSKALKYLTKPLGMCIICNSTWIGIILTFVFIPEFNWFTIISAIIVGCTTAGFVTLLSTYYQILKDKL